MMLQPPASVRSGFLSLLGAEGLCVSCHCLWGPPHREECGEEENGRKADGLFLIVLNKVADVTR